MGLQQSISHLDVINLGPELFTLSGGGYNVTITKILIYSHEKLAFLYITLHFVAIKHNHLRREAR